MKVLFISLGCDKNRVDSEKMIGILLNNGYTITDDETEAEVIIVNTCSFIKDAKEESIETLIEMARMKEDGSCKVLVACGCLSERYKDEFFDELPEVDCIIGTSSWDRVSEAIEKSLENKRQSICDDIDRLPCGDFLRIVTTGGGHYAYLKIAEGCSKGCTYCAIPSIRGRYKSVPEDELIKEAERLVSGGVKELILVAQETTLYGIDIYGKKMLPDLIKKICRIEGLRWIRLLYCYPEEIDDELIKVIKEEPKVCNYLDIPIQHINNRILKQMGRRTSGKSIRALIAKLRREIPDIALRTTMIVGFPGETEEEFQELKTFISEEKFDRLGVFAYSPEEYTAAAQMPKQLPDNIKQKRREELMLLQQDISYMIGRGLIGQIFEVFIEGEMPEEDTAVGRTYRDAPDVDGYVFFRSSGLKSGRFLNVKITAANEYDLMGEEIL